MIVETLTHISEVKEDRRILVGHNVRGLRILSVKLESAQELRDLIENPKWALDLLLAWHRTPYP